MSAFWHWGFESIFFTGLLYTLGWLAVAGLSGPIFKAFRLEVAGRAGWWLLGLGLLLRLAWIVWTQPQPISDYQGYWHLAGEIAAGQLTFDNIDKHPGIILLLALCRGVMAHSFWPAWILNLLLSAFILVLIALLGKRLAGSRAVGLLALALGALQPQLIAYSALLASELPTLALYLLLTWRVLATGESPPRGGRRLLLDWGLTGLILYVAVLTRSTALVFLPLTALLVVFFRRDRWLSNLQGLLMFAVSAGLLLSTWLYHQALLTGQAQLFWGGEIWLVSTTHYATESRLVSPRALPGLKEIIAQVTQGKQGPQARLAELAADKTWAMAIIRRDPLRYLRAGSTRLRHILWTTSETGIRDTQGGSRLGRILPSKLWTRLAELSKQVWRATLLLAVLGLLITWVRWSVRPRFAREGVALMVGFMAIWLGFHFLMAVASDRWAVQVMPYILLFAALFVVEGVGFFVRCGQSGQALWSVCSKAPTGEGLDSSAR